MWQYNRKHYTLSIQISLSLSLSKIGEFFGEEAIQHQWDVRILGLHPQQFHFALGIAEGGSCHAGFIAKILQI